MNEEENPLIVEPGRVRSSLAEKKIRKVGRDWQENTQKPWRRTIKGIFLSMMIFFSV